MNLKSNIASLGVIILILVVVIYITREIKSRRQSECRWGGNHLNIYNMHDTDIDKKDGLGRTPLMMACSAGDNERIKRLLIRGADAGQKDFRDREPIHYYIISGQYQFLETLLDEWIQKNETDVIDPTILQTAISSKNYQALALLCQRGYFSDKYDASGMLPEHHAVKRGDIESLRLIRKAQPLRMFVRNQRGQNLMDVAILSGQKEVVAYLLSIGYKPGITDLNLRTPLHHAAIQGNPEITKMLLKAGFNPHLKDRFEMTPLMLTVINDNKESFIQLLGDKTTIDLTDHIGQSALHFAATQQDSFYVTSLLESGANPNIRDINGVSPLYLAISSGRDQNKKIILPHVADPWPTDFLGNQPISPVLNEK